MIDFNLGLADDQHIGLILVYEPVPMIAVDLPLIARASYRDHEIFC